MLWQKNISGTVLILSPVGDMFLIVFLVSHVTLGPVKLVHPTVLIGCINMKICSSPRIWCLSLHKSKSTCCTVSVLVPCDNPHHDERGDRASSSWLCIGVINWKRR